MKLSKLMGLPSLALVLLSAATPAISTPQQYTYDFSFSGFGSWRAAVGDSPTAVPHDPVTGSVTVTLDLVGVPSVTVGMVDAFTLSTPAFSTTGVMFGLGYNPVFYGGIRYDQYSLTLGRVLPRAPNLPADWITNVDWGTDDFTLMINRLDYLDAGGGLTYSNTPQPQTPPDAWYTYNGVITAGTFIAPPPPSPGSGNSVPEPGVLALLGLGLLGIIGTRMRRQS
jgi:hypothetical protein